MLISTAQCLLAVVYGGPFVLCALALCWGVQRVWRRERAAGRDPHAVPFGDIPSMPVHR